MRQEFIKDPTPTENLEIKLEIELEEVAERLELGARWVEWAQITLGEASDALGSSNFNQGLNPKAVVERLSEVKSDLQNAVRTLTKDYRRDYTRDCSKPISEALEMAEELEEREQLSERPNLAWSFRREDALRRAPWASVLEEAEGGWMAFESADDHKTWSNQK